MNKKIFKDSLFLRISFFYIISKLIYYVAIGWFSNIVGASVVFLASDSTHYYNIANFGYTEDFLCAFFPLIPFILKCFSIFGKTAGVFLFLIFAFFVNYLNVILFYLFGRHYNFSEKRIFHICLIFMLSPISYFNNIIYAEPYMILFSLLLFYILMVVSDKKPVYYILIGVFIGLSVCTKAIGAVYFFSILFYMIYLLFKHKEKIKNILLTYIIATPICFIYPLYLYLIGKSPDIFLTIQYSYWRHEKVAPWMVLIDDIKFWITKGFIGDNFEGILILLNHIVIICCFYFAIKNLKTKKISRLMSISLICFILMVMSNIMVGLPSFSYYRNILSCPLCYILFDVKSDKIASILICSSFILSYLIMIFILIGLPFS